MINHDATRPLGVMLLCKDLKWRARFILKKLRPLYNRDPVGIHYQTPFQLVVGTILSAQCTDKQVNKVTATFFDKLRDPEDYAALTLDEFLPLIKSIGLYRSKAKNILGTACILIRDYGGIIPSDINELVKLPGFGRKTANVVLSALYGDHQGVCVDTHVRRLSLRLGLSRHQNPLQIEQDLMTLVPQKNWHEISHFLILHGRRICSARWPRCDQCVLGVCCPSRGLFDKQYKLP